MKFANRDHLTTGFPTTVDRVPGNVMEMYVSVLGDTRNEDVGDFLEMMSSFISF